MLWILISILSLSFQALAKNSDFTSFVNQVVAGQHCDDVSSQDIRKAGYACRPVSMTNRGKSNPSLIFENLAFDEASQNQVLKNNCMIEKIRTLTGKGRWRETWTKTLYHNWFLAKQTELIGNFCRVHYWDRLANTDENLPPSEAFDKFMAQEIKARPAKKEQILADAKQFKDKCLDETLMKSTNHGRTILLETMPGLSSPAFFKILDENQNLLINRRTNKPLANDDIMRSDLSDLSFVDFGKVGPVAAALDQENLFIAKRREQMNGRIEAARKTGEMPQELKDEIYEDDTVKELFREKKLVPRDPKVKDLNPAVSCLLSRYEPNLVADTAELIGTTVVTGGVIGVAVNSAKPLKIYRMLKLIEKNKILAATGAVSGGRLVSRCLSNSAELRKTKHHIPSEVPMHFEGHGNLTRENAIAYKKLEIAFDEKEIPSCQNARIKNQLVENEHQMNCLLEQLTNVLPMSVGLPVLQFLE